SPRRTPPPSPQAPARPPEARPGSSGAPAATDSVPAVQRQTESASSNQDRPHPDPRPAPMLGEPLAQLPPSAVVGSGPGAGDSGPPQPAGLPAPLVSQPQPAGAPSSPVGSPSSPQGSSSSPRVGGVPALPVQRESVGSASSSADPSVPLVGSASSSVG